MEGEPLNPLTRVAFGLTAILALGSLIACSSPAKSADAGPTDAGPGDAGPADAGPPDAGTPPVDAGDAGALGLTCGGLLGCDQACNSNACTDGCYASSTSTAQGLFDVFDNCISDHCSSADGGPCSDSSSFSCSTCNEGAATGPCIAMLQACSADSVVGPPNPDGGATLPDAGSSDAGSALNCGGVIACQSACSADGTSCLSGCAGQGTPEAQSLANGLARCLTSTCPSTDGGPCANAGPGCTGCETQAEFDNAECGIAFNACETDSSNSPDAGVFPVALQGGTISTLVAGLDQPQIVLVQGGYVYYSQISSDGPVSRVSLTDGGATDLSPSQPYPMGLAVDSNNIYVWNSGSFSGSTTLNNQDGSVVQIPIDGGTPVPIASGMEVAYAAPYLNAIAVDAHRIYWVQGANGHDGSIMVSPIGAASPTALYTNLPLPEAVVTDGVNLYWSSWGTYNAQGQYNNDGTVQQGSVDGGAVITLASNLSAPAALAIDAQRVYWTNAGKLGADNLPAPNTGSVMSAPIGGGSAAQVLASQQAIPLGIAVAGGTAYWVAYTLDAPGQILSLPTGGGTIVPLVAGLSNPFGIAVAGGALFWTDSPPTAAGSGSVLMLNPLP